MTFSVFRHRNKVLVEQFLNNCTKNLDPSKSLSHASTLTPEQVGVMQSLIRWREIATDASMGFAASFIASDGSHFTTSNLDDVSLVNTIPKRLISIPFSDEFTQGRISLIETEEGIQVEVSYNKQDV